MPRLHYRFGLPVDFEAVLIRPNKRNYKKLREVLQSMFEHLDNLAVSSFKDVSGPSFFNNHRNQPF